MGQTKRESAGLCPFCHLKKNSRKNPAKFKQLLKRPIPGTAREPSAASCGVRRRVAQQLDPSALEASAMFENDNSIHLWSFELHRQAAIQRNLVIQAYVRAAARASAEWLRVLSVRGARLVRNLAAERRRRRAIRELQRLDDRMLHDIGGSRGDIEFAVRNTVAAALFWLPIAGAMAADRMPLDCVAADLRLTTLIEAHGQAQDVAAETLRQAFFTVMEARKACNQGQVEAALKLYDSIPLRPVISRAVTD